MKSKLTAKQIVRFMQGKDAALPGNFIITVPKCYDFTVPSDTDSEDKEWTQENYSIKIVTGPDGDFLITGTIDDLESYVDDICIGSKADVFRILKTAISIDG